MQSLLRTSRIAASISRSSPFAQRRSIITLKDHLYTATATASGSGRNGHVKSHNKGGFETKLSTPKALGGMEDAPNPEILFSMGYAGCFLGALQFVASKSSPEIKEAAKNAKVHISVHLGEPTDRPGFGLAVEIAVEGIKDLELVKEAHKTCPYSRALGEGAHVNLSLK